MVEVELLNWSGRESVEIVVNACRITADNLKDDKISNETIVKMLVENDYTSAVEHIWFTFRIKCSIACQRELLEHRIASHTTRSTRYCNEVPKIMLPDIDIEKEDIEMIEKLLDNVYEVYLTLRHKYGREIARYVLPLGLETEFVWTINARSLLNFLGLRLCVRAAPEIRELAEKVLAIVKELVPEIFEGVRCRGKNLGVCPENEARPSSCPYRATIMTKREVKEREIKKVAKRKKRSKRSK